MSGVGFPKISGLRCTFVNHGFVYRPYSSVAVFGWEKGFDSEQQPIFVPRETVNSTGIYYIIESFPKINFEIQAYNHQCFNFTLNGKTKEFTSRFPANQHAFLWEYADVEWITKNEVVFSWYGPSSGDGPFTESHFLNSPHLNRWRTVATERCDSGRMRWQFHYTPFLYDYTFTETGLVSNHRNYSDIDPDLYTWRDFFYGKTYKILDEEGHVIVQSYNEWNFYHQTKNCCLLKNGKLWKWQIKGTTVELQNTLLAFPLLNDNHGEGGVENVDDNYMLALQIKTCFILGVGVVNANRVLCLVYHGSDDDPFRNLSEPIADHYYHRVRLYDISNTRQYEIKYSGDSVFKIPYQVPKPGESSNRLVVPFPFMWNWRFSQDLLKFSGLYISTDFTNYESNKILISVVKKTFTLVYNAELDTYSIGTTSEDIYTPEIAHTEDVVDAKYHSYNHQTNVIQMTEDSASDIQWPYALDYVNNELKCVWFKPSFDIETYNYDEYKTWTTIVDPEDTLINRTVEVERSKWAHVIHRGVKGTLEFDSGMSVSLKQKETVTDETFAATSVVTYTGGSPPWTASGTDGLSSDLQLVPLFISVAGDIAVVGARSTSLHVNRTLTGVDYDHGSPGWNYAYWAMHYTRSDEGGSVVYLYKENEKTTLLDTRETVEINFDFLCQVYDGGFLLNRRDGDQGMWPIPPYKEDLGLGLPWHLYHPLDGLIPGALPIGLCGELFDSGMGIDYPYTARLPMGCRELASYGGAFDRRNGSFLFSLDFGELTDLDTWPNWYTGSFVKNVRVYEEFSTVADSHVVNYVYMIDPDQQQAFEDYIATLTGDNVALIPLGLY